MNHSSSPGWLRRAWNFLFRGVAVRQQILGPVAVNLLTALVLFLVVSGFKDPIYRLLAPQSKFKEFPIYATADAFQRADGQVAGELYLANLEGIDYTGADLTALVQTLGNDQARSLGASIGLKWSAGNGHITAVRQDDEFNLGKGEVLIEPVGGEWSLRIVSIQKAAILRFLIETDYRPAVPLTRAEKASRPFDVVYAGR